MTANALKMLQMGRTRLNNLLPNITEKDLSKKLHPASNSIGFLLRHIAEVEHLFAKNVFHTEVKITTQTIGKDIHDTGKYTDLNVLNDLLYNGIAVLSQAVSMVPENGWSENITTAEFGTITKAEALSRIMTHTAYHAGQIALILKYGA